jgi:hypothetical protein
MECWLEGLHSAVEAFDCVSRGSGRVFAMVKPKLGVVYHYKDEEGLGDAVRKECDGPFVIGRDLIEINIGKTVTWVRESAAHAQEQDD